MFILFDLTFVSVLFFFLRMKNINFVQSFNISTTANLLCIRNIFCLIFAEFLLDSVIPFCPPFFLLYSLFPVNRNSRRFTPHLANCFEVLKGARMVSQANKWGPGWTQSVQSILETFGQDYWEIFRRSSCVFRKANTSNTRGCVALDMYTTQCFSIQYLKTWLKVISPKI